MTNSFFIFIGSNQKKTSKQNHNIKLNGIQSNYC